LKYKTNRYKLKIEKSHFKDIKRVCVRKFKLNRGVNIQKFNFHIFEEIKINSKLSTNVTRENLMCIYIFEEIKKKFQIVKKSASEVVRGRFWKEVAKTNPKW
jgi:hypothetical protein